MSEVLSIADVRRMYSEAHAAGVYAAAEKLALMERSGPRWQVVDEANPDAHKGDPGWQMLGLCGMAWVHLSENGNSRKMRLLRKFDPRCHKSYYGGWDLFYCSFYNGQVIDVHKAGAKAAAEVMRRYGFDAYADSRID